MADQHLIPLVAKLKRLGFAPVHWEVTPTGLRAKGKGKVRVPSHNTSANVCLLHGNLVRFLRETFPSLHKGVRIVTVHPCPFCHPEEAFRLMARYSGLAEHPAAS